MVPRPEPLAADPVRGFLAFAACACAMLRAAASLLRRRCRQRSTVAVGMSGGVDSSVAALLLQQQGHDVVGVHMSNWDGSEDGKGHDCGERERMDAERVCRQLNIGFQEVSFQREYWHEVFTPFLKAYQDGGTPNPDLSCNRHIKVWHLDSSLTMHLACTHCLPTECSSATLRSTRGSLAPTTWRRATMRGCGRAATGASSCLALAPPSPQP